MKSQRNPFHLATWYGGIIVGLDLNCSWEDTPISCVSVSNLIKMFNLFIEQNNPDYSIMSHDNVASLQNLPNPLIDLIFPSYPLCLCCSAFPLTYLWFLSLMVASYVIKLAVYSHVMVGVRLRVHVWCLQRGGGTSLNLQWHIWTVTGWESVRTSCKNSIRAIFVWSMPPTLWLVKEELRVVASQLTLWSALSLF